MNVDNLRAMLDMYDGKQKVDYCVIGIEEKGTKKKKNVSEIVETGLTRVGLRPQKNK